jgi:tRNA-dihydrouridine synthase C
MLDPQRPALILAPMDGLTDAPMRAVQGEIGAFTFAVSEFLRVSQDVPSPKVFRRHVPELAHGGRTPSGLPVQVQLLGGHAGRMAEAAAAAHRAGAWAIDINFGCPAPTVNRHDGGATLLKHPERIREIVAAIRDALPPHIPVSAKLRLGWDTMDAIFENAEMAAEGGASWLTIHGRTKMQGYQPPAYWGPIGLVRERLGIPVVANGDLWSLEDMRRCHEETGCRHFMLGRGALADPRLSHRVARELGLLPDTLDNTLNEAEFDWLPPLRRLIELTECIEGKPTPADGKPRRAMTGRLKQWLKIAALRHCFPAFEAIKEARTVDELFAGLE